MKRSKNLFLLLLFIMTSSSGVFSAEREYLKPKGLWNVPSFSQATTARGGTLVFISGQVSWDENGKVVYAGDLRKQTEQTLDNLKRALEAAGAGFDNLVKLTIFVKDIDETKWRTISEVRKGYLSKEKPPASTMIGVPGLVLEDLLIEIEGIAVVE
jgi:enamine deaminase RidA (YjgF/YER057c/UK114 family)